VVARNLHGERGLPVRELRQHRSIIASTPVNETDPALARDPQAVRVRSDVLALTRDLDPTRPIHNASGWVHVDPEQWTAHHHTQDPAELNRLLAAYPDLVRNQLELKPSYAEQPFMLDEFGGITWIPEGAIARRDDRRDPRDPRSVVEFAARLRGFVDVVFAHEHVVGVCYEQLSDVEEERHGLFTVPGRRNYLWHSCEGLFLGSEEGLPLG